MPKISQIITAISIALVAFVAFTFGWHLIGALWSFVGTLVSASISTLAWLIQLAVTVAMGALVIGGTLLIAICVLAVVWTAYQRAIDSFARWIGRSSEEAKAAATDATALALLASVIGVLAYLTTSDFLNTRELSFPKALTISSMVLVLLKMALYIDSSHVRRAVWPILGIAYLAPFVFGYYIFEQGCSSCRTFRAVLECLFDLRPPKDESEVAPMQVAGHVLIAVFTVVAMLFPFKLATWRRFLGR